MPPPGGMRLRSRRVRPSIQPEQRFGRRPYGSGRSGETYSAEETVQHDLRCASKSRRAWETDDIVWPESARGDGRLEGPAIIDGAGAFATGPEKHACSYGAGGKERRQPSIARGADEKVRSGSLGQYSAGTSIRIASPAPVTRGAIAGGNRTSDLAERATRAPPRRSLPEATSTIGAGRGHFIARQRACGGRRVLHRSNASRTPLASGPRTRQQGSSGQPERLSI